MNIKEMTKDQLHRLRFEVDQQLEQIKQGKKILVWRVIVHNMICYNYHANDYERALAKLQERFQKRHPNFVESTKGR